MSTGRNVTVNLFFFFCFHKRFVGVIYRCAFFDWYCHDNTLPPLFCQCTGVLFRY